jgi:NAD+ synthetase
MKLERISFIEFYEPVVKSIRFHAEKYLVENRLKSVVLGISGGIDSALVAALIRPVCDNIGVELIGRSLPSSTNSSEEITRAINVGLSFCHHFRTESIDEMYMKIVEKTNNGIMLSDNSYQSLQNETKQEFNIRNGNIKARIRMIVLFNMSQLHKGLVLSTDNLTEKLLGFWTINGDVGNFGMIQYLWKTEVYNMSEYLCETELKNTSSGESLRDCIDCHATDGLGVSKSDLDQIMPGWEERHKITRLGYKEVDLVLQHYLNTGTVKPQYENIINRHKRTEFKRNDPVNILREELFILNTK